MKIPMALWARLMPLLDQALDLPRAEREAWLQQQALDTDMAAALRQLLADREQLDSGDFMAELPKLDASAQTNASSASTSSPGSARAGQHSQSGLFAGDMLGPYRLIKPLGQGGMSVVWLAERDDGQMRRHVALKMPHAGPGQALLAERLRRERDILASLEHRNIARLYDVGVTPMGLPFLVLEYIEGQPLPAYCDELKLGLHARLRLFAQVLHAVQYAHTKLVLHRDLKPSNILVSKQGEVKLLDFGIAKLIRDSETGAAPSTELTQHNGHVLTPDYAAPEQIAGSPLTTASDVYALGVILFELLTGQPAFVAEDDFELIDMHLNDYPPSLLELDPTLPPELDAVVQRSLAKYAHERFSSAAEMAGALELAAQRLSS
jgi:serine/threonine-protein kinase